MADTIFFIIMFSLEFSLFYFLPTLNGQQTLFGITLKNDVFQTYGFPILQRYRRDLFILGVGSLAALTGLFLTGSLNLNSLGITYIAATLLIIFFLFRYLKQTWQFRDRRTVSRLATPLKPRRLRDFSNVLIEGAIILLTIAPFLILRFYYPQLPEIVPIHWNAAGKADSWAAKSFSSVFFLPVLIAFLQIFLVILKQDIIQARFRVPAEQAATILSLKEISLQANVGMIDWCRLFVGVLLGTVSLLVLSPVVPLSISNGLNVFTWIGLILLLSGMAFYLYRIVLVNREIKSLTGRVTFQTDDEMQGWIDGLFYYNPQDTAFMVEKPGGVGYTINFARRRAMLYVAMILSPILFGFLDFFLMK